MTPPPPELPHRNTLKTDTEHLRLLSIFHFVVVGLFLLGIAFLWMHYYFMSFFFLNDELWSQNKIQGPPPQAFFEMFKWFYVAMGFFSILGALGNLISGYLIKKRNHRIPTLIIAGINCMQFPFGTALGVFTFLVLLRPSVVALYDEEEIASS